MFAGIAARIVILLILLLNAVLLLAAAIRSLSDLLRPQPETDVMVAALFLAFSFVLGVWILGLVQRVMAKGWPDRFIKSLRFKWGFYVGTLMVGVGLFFLFNTPVELYASLGFLAGTSFAELALRQFSVMAGIVLPRIIVQIAAWEFHVLYASFFVGFCVWVINAVKNVARRGKNPPPPAS